MPINIPKHLPAKQVLKDENIFVMTENHASRQDIRPLKIAIFNLMPLKIATEIQLLRLLSNTPLQVEIELIMTESYKPRHTSLQHLQQFYKTFPMIKDKKYDGMIVTGAPVGQLDFDKVVYWQEFQSIMDWTITNVTSVLYICWAAHAALHHHYGVPKETIKRKRFGVFYHVVKDATCPIVRGFDDGFFVPHSRYCELRNQNMESMSELRVISHSEEAGVYLVVAKNHRQIFVTGHPEYAPLTLRKEYERDCQMADLVDVPRHYFPNNDPNKPPIIKWRSHANLLFSNWLNYYVYQRTPYRIHDIKGVSS